jgi:hypothetical protein
MASERFKLDKEDFVSISKGFGVGLAGAILTYALGYFGNVNFGEWQPIAVAVLAVIANLARKWAVNNKPDEYVDLTPK